MKSIGAEPQIERWRRYATSPPAVLIDRHPRAWTAVDCSWPNRFQPEELAPGSHPPPRPSPARGEGAARKPRVKHVDVSIAGASKTFTQAGRTGALPPCGGGMGRGVAAEACRCEPSPSQHGSRNRPVFSAATCKSIRKRCEALPPPMRRANISRSALRCAYMAHNPAIVSASSLMPGSIFFSSIDEKPRRKKFGGRVSAPK